MRNITRTSNFRDQLSSPFFRHMATDMVHVHCYGARLECYYTIYFNALPVLRLTAIIITARKVEYALVSVRGKNGMGGTGRPFNEESERI